MRRPMTSLLCAGALVMTVTACSDDDSSSTTSEVGGPTTVAKGEDVEIDGFFGLDGRTLNIDAVEQDGEVTGEFQVSNVVVSIQCAGTMNSTGVDSTGRDLILGGEVTDNPDGLATLDGVNVAVGDRLALIIREGGGGDPDLQEVTLYDPALMPPFNDSVGSCTELVESDYGILDGGYFDDVKDGSDIETG